MFTDIIGEVSVNPYPCVISTPVIFFHLIAVVLRTAIPPPIANFKLVKFIFLKVELVINKLNKVLTAVIIVNLYFDNVLTKDFKSLGLVIKTFFDPI